MIYNREILAYNRKIGVTCADELIEMAMQEADLVLLEGFKNSRWPKAEILREGEASVSRDPVALIADQKPESSLPYYHRNDADGIAELILRYLHLTPPRKNS